MGNVSERIPQFNTHKIQKLIDSKERLSVDACNKSNLALSVYFAMHEGIPSSGDNNEFTKIYEGLPTECKRRVELLSTIVRYVEFGKPTVSEVTAIIDEKVKILAISETHRNYNASHRFFAGIGDYLADCADQKTMLKHNRACTLLSNQSLQHEIRILLGTTGTFERIETAKDCAKIFPAISLINLSKHRLLK